MTYDNYDCYMVNNNNKVNTYSQGLEHKLDALGNLQPMKEEEEDEGTFNKHTITELRASIFLPLYWRSG